MSPSWITGDPTGGSFSLTVGDCRSGRSIETTSTDSPGCSPRYRRFLSPKPRLEPRELAHLTNLDYVDHDALAAVDGDRDSIVGVARYARDRSRPSAAHIAFALADDLQGLGIGTMLARLTVQRARENGYELLIATTLWDNRPARALLRRLGFRACGSDQGVVELELSLGARS